MVTVFERRAMPLNNEFDLDITWNRSRAYTVDYETYNSLFEMEKVAVENEKQDSKKRNTSYLVVESYCEIEDFDTISEAAPATRPLFLVMLGMICLLTGIPLTPFVFFNTLRRVADPESNVGEHPLKFAKDGSDFSDELSELVSAMNALSEKNDRWCFRCLTGGVKHLTLIQITATVFFMRMRPFWPISIFWKY